MATNAELEARVAAGKETPVGITVGVVLTEATVHADKQTALASNLANKHLDDLAKDDPKFDTRHFTKTLKKKDVKDLLGVSGATDDELQALLKLEHTNRLIIRGLLKRARANPLADPFLADPVGEARSMGAIYTARGTPFDAHELQTILHTFSVPLEEATAASIDLSVDDLRAELVRRVEELNNGIDTEFHDMETDNRDGFYCGCKRSS